MRTHQTYACLAAPLRAQCLHFDFLRNQLMQNTRYLDKLIDEIAKGRAMVKILRAPA